MPAVSDASTQEKSGNLWGMNYMQVILLVWMGDAEN